MLTKQSKLLILLGLLFALNASKNRLTHSSRYPASRFVIDSSGYLYDPSDTSCDGFPMLQVETLPGTCLGMVLPRNMAKDQDSDFEFIKPRTIVEIPNSSDFLVADMGGWSDFNGRLFWLKKDDQNSRYEIKIVKSKLNLPHGLANPGDGYFYLGEKHQIIRFRFQDGVLSEEETLVKDLPSYKGHMHPLTQFTFHPETMDLYINYGAPTDHCDLERHLIKEGEKEACKEEQTENLGAIYKVEGEQIKAFNGSEPLTPKLLVKGLRNSMAMAVSPTGNYLIQGENSRDFEDLGEPYEELNVVNLKESRQKHYGWPYCFNFNATSPEWTKESSPLDCGVGSENYEEPYILLPPHVAPLGMDYYSSNLLGDDLKGSLILSWHGHQPTGNRLVLYKTDSQGLPILNQESLETTYKVDQSEGQCAKSLSFVPKGGLRRSANYIELISGWSRKKGIRPEGSPVGFEVAEDGSIWIVEDKARVILRLSKLQDHQKSFKDTCENSDHDEKEKYRVYRQMHESSPELKNQYLSLKKNLFQKYCQGCHGNMQSKVFSSDEYSTLDFFVQNEWFEQGEPEKSKVYGAVAHLEAFTPMPPGNRDQPLESEEGREMIKELENWIKNLKK